MATYHLESGTAYPAGKLTAQDSITRRSLLTTIRWGAVLAGVAVGISAQLVLTLLGIASGLSLTPLICAFHMTQPVVLNHRNRSSSPRSSASAFPFRHSSSEPPCPCTIGLGMPVVPDEYSIHSG